MGKTWKLNKLTQLNDEGWEQKGVSKQISLKKKSSAAEHTLGQKLRSKIAKKSKRENRPLKPTVTCGCNRGKIEGQERKNQTRNRITKGR